MPEISYAQAVKEPSSGEPSYFSSKEVKQRTEPAGSISESKEDDEKYLTELLGDKSKLPTFGKQQQEETSAPPPTEEETTHLKSEHAARTPTMDEGEEEDDEGEEDEEYEEEEEKPVVLKSTRDEGRKSQPRAKHRGQMESISEEGEETPKTKPRSYPVATALLEGYVLGFIFSVILFPGIWGLWLPSLCAFVSSSLASRQDSLGRRVRQSSEKTFELMKKNGKVLWGKFLLFVQSVPGWLRDAKERVVELDEAAHFSETVRLATHALKEPFEPRLRALSERVEAADKRQIIAKTKNALYRTNDALGLTRTTLALWKELMEKEEEAEEALGSSQQQEQQKGANEQQQEQQPQQQQQQQEATKFT